ncbi:hypothetical protein, partial [Providencia hangzhouensis]
TLRGLGNTDEGLDVEALANFGVCDYSNYTCNTVSNSTQTVPQSSWVSSFFSALNPVGTAQAFPIGGAMGSGAMASGGVVGGAVGQQETSFGWDNSQESANHRIARHLEHELRKPSPLVLSANILFAMVANYYEGDSLTQPDLLEIAEMGGSAPTRM